MDRIYLNNDWQFAFDSNNPTFTPARIPHSVKELPYNYFSEDEYQTVSLYKRVIFGDKAFLGKKLLLTFDGVAHYAEVFLNGEKVGEHYSGYTAFTIDITGKIRIDEDNELLVKVDSRESLNIPPFGNVIDYMTYGGIYRDVYLDVKNSTYISDVFAKPKMDGTLTCEVEICGDISSDMTICQEIVIDGKACSLFEKSAEACISATSVVKNVRPWSVNSPMLYTLVTQLWQGRTLLDENRTKIGFRDVEFRADGFYLNGERLKIRGLNRHQSYPYVGYAMPRSIQEMDADILKYELGLNAVRTSHYPQSQHFINRCDEIGLLVLMEIPGWQYIGDSEWKDQAVKNVREMVLQYRNHPSIMLWGVRINESRDDDELYTRTNKVAHNLDSTRQTGGIRNFRKSHLLEDVYTYNDFIHNGRLPGCESKLSISSDMSKPYIVTEYNGHMYPTKSFDCEEHRVEHALRHARVLDAISSHSDICGSFGWCMADYNTHKDFGSGDRICYHGVLDMFRNHKLAAAVYASQGDGDVLEISSSMDIGEHPACIKGDIWAFTNADSVKMYKNDRFIKEYKSSGKKFSHMKHRPLLIDDFIGDTLYKLDGVKPGQAKILSEVLNYIARHGYGKLPFNILWKAAQCMLLYGMKYNDIVDYYTQYAGDWGGTSTVYRFDAIKDGSVVKSVVKAPMSRSDLLVNPYKTLLCERESYDVTEIRVLAVDENRNLLHFSNEPISIKTEGPIALIGPDTVSLRGGMAGIYVKTVGVAGNARVILHSTMGDVTVDFTVQIDS